MSEQYEPHRVPGVLTYEGPVTKEVQDAVDAYRAHLQHVRDCADAGITPEPAPWTV